MCRINLNDVAYCAYEATDLDLMERFLTDFGMNRSARTSNALYMRGASAAHHIHVARSGECNRFLGAAWTTAQMSDLEEATHIPGASAIEPIADPGGGYRVTLNTPSGHTIWLVLGADTLPQLPVRRSYLMNVHSRYLRFGKTVRQRSEPTPVLRIGHLVLWVKDAASEIAWFRKHFALTPSDHICAPGDPDPIVKATFLRYDRGLDYVEHHCFLISESRHFGCHHSSFEVLDLDAVVAGHEHLAARGWSLDAGYGRHYLGSLIYDYWLDPFGNRIEHYTDTDLVNDEYEPMFFVGSAAETMQWGVAPPPSFFD